MAGAFLDRAVKLLPLTVRRWLSAKSAAGSPADRKPPSILLSHRLSAAGIEPDYVRIADPATFSDLEQNCGACKSATRCTSDVETGDADEQLAGYCPNTPAVDWLAIERVLAPVHLRPVSSRAEANMEVAMKVKDAMHRDAVWVEATTPVATIAQKMRDLDIGAIPVGENDRLIGMVTDRDIAIRALPNGSDASRMTARDVMSKGIVFCRDTEDVEDAVRIMEQKRIRRLPVLDENRRLVGMLSLGDVAHCAPRQISAEALAAVSGHHA